MRWTTAAAVALTLAVAVALAGCGTAGPPERLGELLDVMPAEAAQRGLYWSGTDHGPGFDSMLPLGGAGALLGVEVEAFTDVLETGGAPLTVLAGSIRTAAVVEAVAARGYVVDEQEDWTRFERGEGAGSRPLETAVPAGAVRRGLLVLGEPGEVEAAIRGDGPVSAVSGVAAVADTLTGASAAAILLSADAIVRAAAADGGVAAALDRADASGDLPAWRVAALSWEPSGEGAVALAYDAGEGGHDAARALVLRAATTPLLGEGRRRTADLFERGAPRWDVEHHIARLPVRWLVGPEEVRGAIDAGALLFLAPTP